MAFLVDHETRIVVQGLTGSSGRMGAVMMQAGGRRSSPASRPERAARRSRASRCSTPSRRPRSRRRHRLDPLRARRACCAMRRWRRSTAGMDPIVLMVDGVALDLSLELVAAPAKACGVTLIGPNSPGVISPGKSLLGALRPDPISRRHRRDLAQRGHDDTICYQLTQAGRRPEHLRRRRRRRGHRARHPGRRAPRAGRPRRPESIFVFGEVGTSQEERLADMVRRRQGDQAHVRVHRRRHRARGAALLARGRVGRRREGGAQAKREVLAAAGITVLDRYVEARDI